MIITHKHKIIIARHGETDSNRERIVQLPDNPLNGNGIRMAEELAATIKMLESPIHQIISSDLFRSIQTAKIVSDILKIPIIDKSSIFAERNFGILRGMTHTEIIKLYPECSDEKNKRMATHCSFPGGESFDEVKLRAQHAIEYINNLSTSTLIVSHGAFMRIIASTLNESVDPDTLSFGNAEFMEIN